MTNYSRISANTIRKIKKKHIRISLNLFVFVKKYIFSKNKISGKPIYCESTNL